ncbi:MAG: Asp-tRNA(Asn)/Glu-tRNA(Gln) amidotransferase subunit GatC [Candidatus Woesearchaeota archaeon]
MNINAELVKRVADVSKLKFTDNEINKFLPEMKEILEYFKLLNDIDTKDVEPSFHPIKLKNWFREDKPEKTLTQNEALFNSSQNQEGYFKGPKAV